MKINMEKTEIDHSKMKQLRNTIALGLAALTVISNGLIGHFFAPNGIMLTPFVLTITTLLVCFGTKNIRIIFISVLTYLFVALNDISIKLYSGGSHDSEGLGLINGFLFLGLVPTFLILLASVLISRKENIKNKLIAVLLFFALIAAHLKVFGKLGLGRHY